jgi:ATP synthase protein I
MTTAPPTPLRCRPVLGPLTAGSVLGLILVGLAVAVSGPPAAAGALVGTVLVVAVFAFGGVVLTVVASVSPAASLVVALLTYTLQVVVVGLVYVGLRDAGALDGPVDPRWLAAAVISATLAWTTTQIAVTVRTREPIYDLTARDPEASVR